MEEIQLSGHNITSGNVDIVRSGGISSRVITLIELGYDSEGKKLVMQNSLQESMGTISYQFYDQDSDYSTCKICSINFFGTQNGRKESEYRKRLDWLGDYSSDRHHLSYRMMEEFITKICHPRGTQKVYLDADGPDKKIFWKEKMGKYLIKKRLVQEQSYKDMEVCYVLKT